MAALGTVANGGCGNRNNYQDKEERVYGKDDHECAGTVGADGH
ncbi:MAG: hypothetical protein ACOX4V_06730 [Anaerovoracaceae bacterium]